MSRRLALVVGNSDYLDPKLARLAAPGEDVNDLAEVLRAPEIGGFDEVTSLVNASAPAVRRSIARFFTDKRPDDLLLLYFSGHGVRDDNGRLYLAVQDTEYDLLNATAIPAAFVTDEMDRSRSRRQVLILDCCHSGAFAQGAKGAPGQSVGTATAFEGTGYGRVVLTATDSTQFAWEGDQLVGEADNSVFTHHVLDGLRTGAADTDGDGRITLDELYDFVYERVVNQTPKQTPRKFTYNQQGEVVLALNPHAAPKPATLAPDLLMAVNSPLAGVREGVVRELEQLLKGSQPAMALAARAALERLATDDSRRVSSAARAALGLDPTVTQAPWTTTPLPSAPPVPAERNDQPLATPHEQAAAEAGKAGAPPAAISPTEGRVTPRPETPAAKKPEAPAVADVGKAGLPPRTAMPAADSATAQPPASAREAGPAATSDAKPSSPPPGVKPTEGQAAAQPRTAPPKRTDAPAPSAAQPTPAQAQPARKTAADSTSPRKAVAPAQNTPIARPSVSTPPAAAPPKAAAASGEQAPSRMVDAQAATGLIVPQRVAVVLVGVGCALGWGLAKLALDFVTSLPGETYWPSRAVYWVIAYSLTGLTLGIVLRLRRPALPWSAVLGLAAAWGAASVAGFAVRYVVQNHTQEVFGQVMGLGIVGVIGGRALNGALYRADGWPAPRSRTAVIIVGAWVAGLCLTLLADWASGYNIPSVLLGAVAGLFGGEVLFRQLGQVGRAAPSSEEPPAGVLTTPSTPVLLLAAGLTIVAFVGLQFSQVLYSLWSDAPELLVGMFFTVVIAPLAGAVLAVVIGWVHRPLGAAGTLALAVIWTAAAVLHAAVIFLLFQVSIDGTLPANLLYGAVGGAAAAGYVAWRIGQKPSLGLLATSAGAWALAFALAALLNDAWYDWTNVAAVSAAAALGSIPLFYYLHRHPTT